MKWTMSVHPIDVGFDPRVTETSVEVFSGQTVRYLTSDGEDKIATGTHDQIVRELAAAGYEIIAAKTPNGRNIEFSQTKGKYAVQPHNDNYLIFCATLEEALDAYHHPDKYRP